MGGPAHRRLKLQAETYDTVQALLGELNAARALLHLLLAPTTEDRARQVRKQWEEIATGVDARFERQAAAVTQTNVVAQEIRTTSELAASRATSLLGAAERADKVGRSGMEVLTESLQGIQNLRGQFDAIAQHVVELAEHSVKVSTITDTVRDLAAQSHVLALTAGIEAARAGQQGQGFTVVALEIRSLADRSVKATFEVREQMKIVGGAMRDTVAITATGSARMQQELEQVRTSGKRLEELTQLLQESSAHPRGIVSTVRNQHAEQLRSTPTRLTEALSGFRL
ncbi:methyl-accepting chemotaxis protein [Archangium sp.]|uniref:methyl-accepting chemotaxis protein n=1 Tax=Archangium sp. TaxID=1872627 RepID=UPI00286BDADD|nr:methyl-accepting chemotaxis protein [Archangium sp.]